jgi:2-amino-4-hydroxy-6-hydroxymethyldihydropteridine diphosphokinase
MTDIDARALVALGTNLPHRGRAGVDLLGDALHAIAAADLPVLRVSSAWESPAWPPSDQPNFINAAAWIDAGGRGPQALYAILRDVELGFGRTRRERWAARTLDLDLVDMGGYRGEFDGIIIPHPRAHERAFVLAPLAEIAPDWRPAPGEPAAAEHLAAIKGAELVRRLAGFRDFMPPDVAVRPVSD